MASSIRLLPLKKAERVVLPYAVVLGRVLTKRFIRACFTMVLFVVFITMVLNSSLLYQFSFERIFFTLILSSFLGLLRSKLVLCIERPAYSSAAAEFIGSVISRNFVKSLICYGLSTYVYYKNIISRVLPVYEQQQVFMDQKPEGVPESLALHLTSTWYSVNNSNLSLAGFGLYMAVAFSLLTIKDFVLDLRPQETGLKPFQRLKLRFHSVFLAIKQWLVLALVWPFFYLAIGRRMLFSLYKFWLGGTVVLSPWGPGVLLLPVLLLPLSITWSVSYQVFMVYISLGPLHGGKLISDLAIVNANSTLANGLSQSFDSITALMAWQELLVISEHFKNRRISIYADVYDEFVLWEEISKNFNRLIRSHINELTKSTPIPSDRTNNVIELMKYPVEAGTSHVFTGMNKRVNSVIGDEYFVSVEKPQQSLFRPQSALEKKLEALTTKLESNSSVHTDKTRIKIQQCTYFVVSVLRKWSKTFLHTRIGSIFLHTRDRKLLSQIRNRRLTSFALRAIARMITHSLDEDEDGYVQGTIGPTLALMDELATILEKLLKEVPLDNFNSEIKSSSAKTDASCASNMLAEVNRSYLEVSESFSGYLENLGLTSSVKRRCQLALAGNLDISTTLTN